MSEQRSTRPDSGALETDNERLRGVILEAVTWLEIADGTGPIRRMLLDALMSDEDFQKAERGDAEPLETKPVRDNDPSEGERREAQPAASASPASSPTPEFFPPTLEQLLCAFAMWADERSSWVDHFTSSYEVNGYRVSIEVKNVGGRRLGQR